MDQQGLPPHLCLGGKGLGMAESNIHLDVWGRWAQRAGSVPFPNISPGFLSGGSQPCPDQELPEGSILQSMCPHPGQKGMAENGHGLLGGDRPLSMGYPSLGQPLDTSIEVQN